jgi:hypothetical protein
VVKNGHKRGKQLYKCKDCNRQFVGGKRLNVLEIESEYIDGKQTLQQISQAHGVCVKTVWNILSGMRHKHKIAKDKDVVVLMDTTYWGRHFGVVIMKDALRNKVLWLKFIKSHERIADYVEGVNWLNEHNFRIWGIVCDGMKGLFSEFRSYPVQMCQFHMIGIVKRYLTSKPDIEAASELLALIKCLTELHRDEFEQELQQWYTKWHEVMSERHTDRYGKSHYVRPRLRAAYYSIKRHIPWLWTFEKYQDRIIPNTNAGIESLNSRLKTALRVHSGISSDRRKKLIENYIATHY